MTDFYSTFSSSDSNLTVITDCLQHFQLLRQPNYSYYTFLQHLQLFRQQTYSYYRCLQHFYVTTGVAQAISNVSGLHLATTS